MSEFEHDTDVEDEIGLNCGRLSCGKVIVQPLGRGRRKEYCSDTCRRAADRDYKRAKSRVEVLDEQLRKTRYHVAAYGRKAEEGIRTPEQLLKVQADARVAFTRAATVVELGASIERAQSELKALVEALRPLLEAGPAWFESQSA